MADTSAIEWCDSTLNPWIGCEKISPGCDNCYAAAQDNFRKWTPEGWGGPRKRTSAATWAKPLQWNAEPFGACSCGWRGELRHAAWSISLGKNEGDWCPHCFMEQLKPARRRVFCASLADVFDNEIDIAWRTDLFELIRTTPALDWLVLTKRIGNVRKMLAECLSWAQARGDRTDLENWLGCWIDGDAPAGIWLGATVVNQEEADRDIPKLLATPARVCFLSMEPLLGPVDLREFIGDNLVRICPRCHWKGRGPRGSGCPKCGLGPEDGALDWIIVGGESGQGARPMHPDWARSLRDQCASAGVPFLFKQNGEWASVSEVAGPGAHHRFPDSFTVRRVGKKAAGRLLDGVTHDGFPEVDHE